MFSWIIAERMGKLSRPPVYEVHDQSQVSNSDDCFFRYFNDGVLDLIGIAKKYSDYGVTVEDIKKANPDILLSMPVGLVLKIPYQCPKIMDKKFYMDSQIFKSSAIPKNGSLLLSFCYMDIYRRRYPHRCEEYFNYNRGFDKDANLVSWKQAMDAAYLEPIEKPSKRLRSDQYELRKYNIDGKIHYAVLDPNGELYDPGRNLVKDSYPYESRYFQQD
ncbi:hypothetical protein TVAG_564270 [Trichomonas vaginalis G3]|uniref:LysM domain-containing protein n=2 Tax=Trichomonas vaginalis (strain ATCC PRA-98 / G3) TaxID=412133 RepID=A2GB91_TRIV3|nr:hypothetical protein TVAG_564270 [Trichomonas vaginalis G3]|eukprot:XP_001298504.1 hypothetical protein [Trichomonas vaginalis G3]